MGTVRNARVNQGGPKCAGIVGLILGDVLMVLIDPRINFGKKEGGR